VRPRVFRVPSKPVHKDNAVTVRMLFVKQKALGSSCYSRSGVSGSTTTVNPVSGIGLYKRELGGSPIAMVEAEATVDDSCEECGTV
jgi:hypothetical protein